MLDPVKRTAGSGVLTPMRELACLALFVACRGGSPRALPDAGAPAEEAAAPDAHDEASLATIDDASPPDAEVEAPPPARVTAVITKWNDAHDAAALRSIYADRVFFYGVTLGAADAAARKQAAFSKASGYTQTLRDVHVHERGDRWVAKFTKRSTSGGKTTDQESVLYIVGDRVTAEIDALEPKWCYANQHLVVPPFTIDEAQAEAHALRAHTWKGERLHAPGPDYVPFVQELTCPDPTECPSGETRSKPPSDDDRDPPCYFITRIGIGFPETAKEIGGNGHQWLDMGSWVDGVTDVLWFQDWLSDAGDEWHRDPKK